MILAVRRTPSVASPNLPDPSSRPDSTIDFWKSCSFLQISVAFHRRDWSPAGSAASKQLSCKPGVQVKGGGPVLRPGGGVTRTQQGENATGGRGKPPPMVPGIRPGTRALNPALKGVRNEILICPEESPVRGRDFWKQKGRGTARLVGGPPACSNVEEEPRGYRRS